MSDLGIYLHLGFKHIISWGAWDHILFVLVLTFKVPMVGLEKTIGAHNRFYYRSFFNPGIEYFKLGRFSSNLIEILIPITIILTAFSNFWVKSFEFKSKYPLIYFLALFFGLIHGLGFSTYLKSLLGMETSIIGPLFTFNLGLELGQLLIVGLILIISFIFVSQIKAKRIVYLQIGSGVAIAVALTMVLKSILPIIK